jgi:hypothetical protein
MGLAPVERNALRTSFQSLATLLLVALTCASLRAAGETSLSNNVTVVLVVGAAGESEFGSNFVEQAELWTKVIRRAGAGMITIGLKGAADEVDREVLKRTLASERKDGGEALWLVLIGHGTFDGKEARFNLRGPDLTPTDLVDWFGPFHRPVVIINTAAASAPWLSKLSGTNRVVVTATRSGNEQNFSRFGLSLARAMSEESSDLDKDGQVSILEAFLSASSRVVESYESDGRLITEHALIDDDGNGLGTPSDWFRGVLPIKKPTSKGTTDGARARQLHLVLSNDELALAPEIRAKRDALELEIARLRETKSQRPLEAYYEDLEKILTELSKAYGDQL